MAWLMVSTFGYALALPFLQDDRTRQRNQGAQNRRTAPASRPSAQNGNQVRNQPRNGNNAAKDGDKKSGVNAQPLLISEDTIPDSLLHPRWQIQRTQPFSLSDLYQSPLDLKRPDALKYDVIYNDTINRYIIGNKMGNTWLSAPIMLTPAEYLAWTELNERNAFYRKKNDEIYQAKGKEKFDFTDMHFDLGPAEKIFGPGGIRVKTQGSAELKFGINKKNIDNPSLPIRNRKTTMMNFDEKINLNLNGKIGDKMNLNLN